jgi:hypothetical protein
VYCYIQVDEKSLRQVSSGLCGEQPFGTGPVYHAGQMNGVLLFKTPFQCFSIPIFSALVSSVGTFGVGSSRMSPCAAFWNVC